MTYYANRLSVGASGRMRFSKIRGTITYAQLPTGNGSWDSGSGTTITITRKLTVTELLTATAGVTTTDGAVDATRTGAGVSVLIARPTHATYTGAAIASIATRAASTAYQHFFASGNSVTVFSVDGMGLGSFAGGVIVTESNTDADNIHISPSSTGHAYFKATPNGASNEAGLQLARSGGNSWIMYRKNDDDVLRFYLSADELLLTTAALSPAASTGLTLGTASLPWGQLFMGAPIRLMGYTVAGLPAGTQGDVAFVTNALAPTFLTAVVGGGAVVTPVFYDGTNWVAF